jgi:hypothetical protein
MHYELLLAATLAILSQDAPAAAPPQPTAAPKNLVLEYAQAKLQLAQTNLKRIEQMNRRLARTVPANVVAEFQYSVEEANVQVRDAASAAAGDEFGVWMRRARSDAQAANNRYNSAVAGNRRVAGTFDPLDVERLRLRALVTRLQWERGQSLQGAPRESQLEWQVELLNNQIDRLKEEPPRASPTVRYYPLYWYWY